MLYLVCTTISRVDHARYEVPYAQELGTCIWGPCYNSTFCVTGINVICTTGKNINPKVSIQNQGILHCINGRRRRKSYRTGR